MKSVTLLVLAMMLRPSDFAPKAAIFNKEKQDLSGKLSLTTDDVQFNQDGTMTITLHGIKNDYSRDGFEVTIRPVAEIKLDPIATLRCYMERTLYQRSVEKPLFLSVKSPLKHCQPVVLRKY